MSDASSANSRRRFLVHSGLGAGLAAGASVAGAATRLELGAPAAHANHTAAHDPQDLCSDVETLQQAMQSGRLTAERLTRRYLARIEQLNLKGPQLRAVLETNPDAVAQARALDAERRAGKVRGPLHGIPVLLKDNIATHDRQQTTAGSLALVGVQPPRDAHLVARLREAGAIILGKTNLSEWANLRSTRSTSGWSARGGQARNPHVLDRNTSGSSSGSGAAAAASLAAITVGTETDGSVVSPASICGVVGLKPTVGLISRDGIIPLSASQDTAGPMTRSVADTALLLDAIAGRDPRDAATQAIPAERVNYRAALRVDGLKGARIGVIRTAVTHQPETDAVFERALAVLKAQGAVVIDGLDIPEQARYRDSELTVLMHEFKDGLRQYLQDFAPGAPIKTMADLIAWNQAHAEAEMPFFAQELLEQAEAAGDLTSPAYREALVTNQRYSRTEGLDKLFAQHQLDAVVAPTGTVAWVIDSMLGDHVTAGGFTTPFAVAGYPHLTVPMGFVKGLPVGLSFGGLAWQEAKLLRLGYAFEQAAQARRNPAFKPTLGAV